MINRSICFFIQNISRPAGSERVTSLIANKLAEAGFDIYIISICGNESCFYKLDDDIHIKTLIKAESLNNKIHFFSVLQKYDMALSEIHPQIVIDVFASLSIFSLLLKEKYHFKNITWEHFNFYINSGCNRIGRLLAKRYSDYIITLTQTDKDNYINNRSKSPVEFISNPTPFDRRMHSFTNKNVISVGRLTYQKGYDLLLEGWKLIEKKTDWVLYIIGDGEEREKLESIIKNNNIKNVHLLGNQKNIEDFYNNSNLYVSTSRFEGLPMTLIEAQSFGLPILSSNFETGAKEIVTSGENGLIIENGESFERTLAEAMLTYMQDEELIQIQSSKALSASSRFAIDEISKKWLTIINKLMD